MAWIWPAAARVIRVRRTWPEEARVLGARSSSGRLAGAIQPCVACAATRAHGALQSPTGSREPPRSLSLLGPTDGGARRCCRSPWDWYRPSAAVGGTPGPTDRDRKTD